MPLERTLYAAIADVLAPSDDDPMSAARQMDRDGRTALHYAARDGDLDAVRGLIAQGLDVQLADRVGFTPLHFVAQGQYADLVPMFVAAGADVDARDVWGNTPLARAVVNSRGRGETILALLAGGADAHAENNYGNSPYSTAQKVANYDLAQFFTV